MSELQVCVSNHVHRLFETSELGVWNYIYFVVQQ